VQDLHKDYIISYSTLTTEGQDSGPLWTGAPWAGETKMCLNLHSVLIHREDITHKDNPKFF
jgi:hypothetical protein